MATARVKVALVNDYELIVAGLSELLRPHSDEFHLLLEAGRTSDVVDIALYDSFAMAKPGWDTVAALCDDTRVKHVAIYTKGVTQLEATRLWGMGVDALLSKSLSGETLARALRDVAAGHKVNSREFPTRLAHGSWPGRDQGLTERESEVLALICQGLSNEDIAQNLHVSGNTLKSYIRAAYRKMGVNTRSEAVLWGVRHSFHQTPPRLRS